MKEYPMSLSCRQATTLCYPVQCRLVYAAFHTSCAIIPKKVLKVTAKRLYLCHFHPLPKKKKKKKGKDNVSSAMACGWS